MTFHDRVLFSEDFRHPEKVKEKLHKNKGLRNLYVVVFKGESLKPEIYSTFQFKQKSFNTNDLNVIGVYKSEDEALELIRVLAEISVQNGTEFDFRDAFEKYREVSE